MLEKKLVASIIERSGDISLELPYSSRIAP
jgi:hypothetical protein